MLVQLMDSQYNIEFIIFPNEFRNVQKFVSFIRITNCRRLFPLWFECVKLSTVNAFRPNFQFCFYLLYSESALFSKEDVIFDCSLCILHICRRHSIPSFFFVFRGRKYNNNNNQIRWGYVYIGDMSCSGICVFHYYAFNTFECRK